MAARNTQELQKELADARQRIAELEKRIDCPHTGACREGACDDRIRILSLISFEAVGLFDETFTCIEANPASERLFGYAYDELIGMSQTEFVSPKWRPFVVESRKLLNSHPKEIECLRKDGSTFPAEIRGSTVTYAGKSVRVTAVLDISKRKQSEALLQNALNELEIIFESSKVGIMQLKGGRFLHRGNQALADLLGYTNPAEMIGMNMRQLHLSDESFETFGKNYYEAMAARERIQVEYQLRRKDGSSIWCELSGKALDTNTPADLTKGVLWVLNDISRFKEEEERLTHLASTDHLTGVHNRRHFGEVAQRELARRSRHYSHLSLLLLDLDHFKSINDSHGHGTGDAVLQTFASRCCATLREIDTFGRFGGEEFAVLMPDTDLEGARVVAERIRHAVSSIPCATQEGEVTVTVSIGVTTAMDGDITIENLLTRADRALYKAKRAGRNKVMSDPEA